MAEIVGGFLVSHDPLLFLNPRKEDPTRALAGYEAIRARVVELGATAAVVIGADHYILFGPNCLPQMAIGIGDVQGPVDPLPGVPRGPITSHPALARHILDVGHEEGFDWTAAKTMGVDHSIGVPVRRCLPEDGSVATVPVYLAAGVEPLIRTRRAYELGRSIRRAVASFPGEERVVVIGSGGLSHWVGLPQMGRINREFDKMILDAVERGDAESLVAMPDAYVLEHGGNGALEIRQLLCAMGATQGGGQVIAYEAWPGGVTGLGFAELRSAA
ncbi:protocatechuate 3,4-dioxygenase [Phenylobacterium aquaticum]|uniref:DODA-type extradiol aromatic ring-opening family dioxygenase n=1 Tax=Phenylobacterium aquaticum TaxID=1763816 RepID=UPI001F5CF2D5|nr:protocatechuate 3,4-dioxygenase [Phenylobacterium aquaticum]MCI3133344.1 protocatechuate 3,4-dioxygenase [Phenylobacterium aquaticum]